MLNDVASALRRVGSHPSVPFEVTPVEGETVWLTLSYRAATPVCCGEPGCYIAFLGLARAKVPGALGLERVRMHVSVRFEPGYCFTELEVPANDWETEYGPEHFA